MSNPDNTMDGEKPPEEIAENDGVQPQDTDPNSLVENADQEALGQALWGSADDKAPKPEATPENKEQEEEIPDGEKPPEKKPDTAPTDEGEQSKSPRRISVSGFTDEAKKEAAEAADMVRKGEAVDLFDALSKIRGIEANQQPTQTTPDPNAEVDEGNEQGDQADQSPEDKLATLREHYNEADDNFDKAEMRRINAEIQEVLIEIAEKRAEKKIEAKESKEKLSTYEKDLDDVFEQIETEYPEFGDQNSTFSKMIDDRIEAARSRNDPALRDPKNIKVFADEIAKAIGLKNQVKPPTRPTPAPVRQTKPVGSALAPGHSAPVILTESQAKHAIENASPEELEKALFSNSR